MSRRHDSLIPLSHQHQHALALALLIRRRIGVEKGEEAWREEMAARVQASYQIEIAGHFDVEETILFPQMERYLGRIELISELRQEHHSLRQLIRILGQGAPLARSRDKALSQDEPEGRATTNALDEFSRII